MHGLATGSETFHVVLLWHSSRDGERLAARKRASLPFVPFAGLELLEGRVPLTIERVAWMGGELLCRVREPATMRSGEEAELGGAWKTIRPVQTVESPRDFFELLVREDGFEAAA